MSRTQTLADDSAIPSSDAMRRRGHPSLRSSRARRRSRSFLRTNICSCEGRMDRSAALLRRGLVQVLERLLDVVGQLAVRALVGVAVPLRRLAGLDLAEEDA